MVKKQYLSFHSKNKRGIVFTLDVTIALIIVIMMLAISNFFAIKMVKDPLVNLQSVRVGSDFVNILERQGYLDNPDGIAIETYLNNTLPPQYQMMLEGSGEGGCVFTSGAESPKKDSVTSAKIFFTTGGNYCSLQYKIWLI